MIKRSGTRLSQQTSRCLSPLLYLLNRVLSFHPIRPLLCSLYLYTVTLLRGSHSRVSERRRNVSLPSRLVDLEGRAQIPYCAKALVFRRKRSVVSERTRTRAWLSVDSERRTYRGTDDARTEDLDPLPPNTVLMLLGLILASCRPLTHARVCHSVTIAPVTRDPHAKNLQTVPGRCGKHPGQSLPKGTSNW